MKPCATSLARYFAIFVLIFSHIAHTRGIFDPDIPNHGGYKPPSASSNSHLVPLIGHVPSEALDATIIGPLDSTRVLDISIVLQLNNEDELEQYLLDMLDPSSARYRQFISPSYFLNRYAPTEDQVAQARNYLENNGLTVTSIDCNRLVMHASGTVLAINNIFNTEIKSFEQANGSRFYAPAFELQVDEELIAHSIHGLENVFHAKPKSNGLPAQKKLRAKTINGLTPTDIKTAYSLTKNLDGSGQKIALFELDGFDANDITAYQNQFGLPNTAVTTILVGDATGVPGAFADQVTTDIELALGLAPGVSEILVYEGVNTAQGILDTFNQIAADNLAQVISSSWGSDESQTLGSLILAEAQVFKQMVAQGQSMFVASGNHGAYADGTNLSVQDPASQPLVVAVGGTSISRDNNGNYASETTWFDSSNNLGSGGGVSSIWHTARWQQAVVGDGGASYDFRNVPDVSLNADPNTGYAVYFNGQWTVQGGTGAASSLWAAFMALVNQSLVSNGHNVMGLPSQFLYKAALEPDYATLFHDINDNSTNGYYPGIDGYDIATGLGSLNADALIDYFTTTTPPVNTCIRNNPTVIVIPSAQIAQAGDNRSFTIYLTNEDNNPCGLSTFDLSATLPSGLSASFDQSSVTLQPNDSTTLTATIASNANTQAGNYSFSINATNEEANAYIGSAQGTYQILDYRGEGPNLTVSPVNGTIFHPSSATFAIFQIIFTDGQAGIPNQPITLTVQGPDYYYQDSPTLGSDGSLWYYLLIDQAIELGSYTVAVSSDYNNDSISGQTSFYVDLPFPK